MKKPRRLPKYLKELKFDVIQMTDENTVIGGERFILPINKYRPIKK